MNLRLSRAHVPYSDCICIIPENSDEYLFRAISASGKRKGLISINKPISYSTYRQSFKKSFSNIVPDISSLALIQLGQVELL